MSVFTPDVTVEGGNAVPVKVDGSSVTQPVSISGTVPVSGTVTANLGTVDGLALDSTLTGGTAKFTLVSGATATITQVSVTNAVSITLLAANVNRKKAIFMMPSVGTSLLIAFGATASVTIFTYRVTTNQTFIEVTNYTGVISAISTGAANLVNVTEIV